MLLLESRNDRGEEREGVCKLGRLQFLLSFSSLYLIYSLLFLSIRVFKNSLDEQLKQIESVAVLFRTFIS